MAKFSDRPALNIDVIALDASNGYVVRASGRGGGGESQLVTEHYATEAALKTRLAAIFDAWAATVNAE